MTLALVLLDLQKGILHSRQIPWEDATAPVQVARVAAELLAAAREGHVPVVHVGVVRPYAHGIFDTPRTTSAQRSGKVPRDVVPLHPGSTDVEFVHGPIAGEEVVHKVGVSAFQGSRLDTLLRHGGVDEVMVAGVFTHMVVESTVRQGFDLGYRMVVVEDGCSAPAEGPHRAALSVGIPNFATVVDSEHACRRLRSEHHD